MIKTVAQLEKTHAKYVIIDSDLSKNLEKVDQDSQVAREAYDPLVELRWRHWFRSKDAENSTTQALFSAVNKMVRWASVWIAHAKDQNEKCREFLVQRKAEQDYRRWKNARNGVSGQRAKSERGCV